MPHLFVIEAFHVRDILLFFLDNIGIYGRGVIVVTLFLSSLLGTCVMVLIFFAGLILVGGKTVWDISH